MLREALLAALAAAPLCGAVQGGPRLDPELYAEPPDAEYWGVGDGAPRLRASELTQESFERRVLDGGVFVVEGAAQDWPMRQWDCDYFRSDPTFSGAEMNQQYAASGGTPFVGFKSDWLGKRAESGAKDQEAPQVAPFYWGIKDVQYSDAHTSKTWKRSMLRKVQESVKVPPFMDPGNLENLKTTPEFWFSGSGAGAKAHMDTHVQTTMSLQLAGAKRWRLGYMGARTAPYLAYIYSDGEVYEGHDPWRPQFNVTLRPGEALFVPPGFVHETLNVEEEEGSCAASVTFQFAKPMASRLYRRFFPRVRRTADIHEAWPLIADWAALYHAPPQRKGLPYAEAKAQALGATGVGAAFRALDKDGSGSLSRAELADRFGGTEARTLLGFHDLDEDGEVAREEFAEVYGFWAGTTKAVVEETPKKYRKYQTQDMIGDFNIEDLPKKVARQILQKAREQERHRSRAAAAAEL